MKKQKKKGIMAIMTIVVLAVIFLLAWFGLGNY